MPKILLGSFIICPLVIHEHFDKRLLLAHFAITVTIYDFILGLQLEILIAISTYKHIKVAMGGRCFILLDSYVRRRLRGVRGRRKCS